MANDYTRGELIEICKKAVIHHTKWDNRDSYSAQCCIRDIYLGLTAGLEYTLSDDTDNRTIWLYFTAPIDHEKLSEGQQLEISSREDYFNDFDPNYESEMFDGSGIDFTDSYLGGYMPTPERLENVGEGNDWY